MERIIIRQEELERWGVRNPHAYLTQRFGTEGKDWRYLLLASICGQAGQSHDQFLIELSGGTVLALDFEISPTAQHAIAARFRQL